ncbi:nucleotidyltransferase domain-containing protein [Oscillatoria sp. CS-180]|uniref:nucleotidyltransferase family protein n=1 Tax=Oscillatoria sp. CS-180 TaxID=3021720 RepID=UPI002330908F|nr:nucleotidyltransferase domain-containing protein [Oscillatoria sp. CS-180]MDB9526286.1 nucleotidyltransferase domain-containing protein [Oscillatoria sp. CS-180]
MEKLAIEQALLPADVLLDLTMAGSVLSRYGANQVILYGSMARGTYRPDSDIDLCVEGLPSKNFFRALAECLMASHRSLSIIDFDNSHGYFRERILTEGKVLMSVDILKQEIAFGLENLNKVYDNIETFSKLEVEPKIKVSALTYECLGYYNAIEHLIIRFLKYLSIDLPTGKFSHRDTLRKFDSLLKERDVAGSQEIVLIITNLMAFRHVATKIYGFLINADKLNTIVEDINIHHNEIEKIFYELLETF